MKKLSLHLLFLSILFSAFCQDKDLPNHFEWHAKNFPNHVFWKGQDDKKNIALTFDDGPSDVTSEILDLLKKHKLEATFFWQGSNVLKHPEIVKRAINEGHEIGNHSWDHPNCYEMSPAELWNNQLRAANQAFDSLFGFHPKLYRPPFGGVSDEQLSFLADQGILTILWSVSTMDWDTARNSAKEILVRFEDGIHPGTILLFHDVDFNDSLSEKLKALETIILRAKDENYFFTTTSEIINTYK